MTSPIASTLKTANTLDSRKEPQSSDEPGMLTWRYVLDIAREHRRELTLANLTAIFATAAAVPVPLLLPLLVDEVLLHKPGPVVGFINGLMPQTWHVPVLYIGCVLATTMLLRVLTLAFNVWTTRQFTRISKDVIYRMRVVLLQRLENVSMSEFETLGSGTVASRLVVDMETVDQFVGSTLSRLLVAVLSIAGMAAVLLWIHWEFALFILFANPIVIYFTVTLGKRVAELKKRENTAYEIFQQSLIETLESVHQIRASNRERHYVLRMIDQARDVRDYGINFVWRSDAAGRLSFLTFVIGIDTFRGVALLMVLYSTLSIGKMFAVFGYLWFMMGPVQEVLNIHYGYFAASAALKRLDSLCTLPREPVYTHEVDPFAGKVTVGVRVSDLHFAYGEGPDILCGVNLDIPAGRRVALVGASGGGKSTMVSVLIGLYPAKRGTVYYDGVPVTRVGLEVVREHVATVLQHPALFNDTIRNNLTLGRDLPDAALWETLEVAQLGSTVRALHAGLDTILGRDGVRFSGGQRQRLAIARMALTNPSVVILDEATSALDAETEYHLHMALGEFLKGRTTLIVAHRLSAIKQADHVYVFESGTISEEGSHQDLLAQNGLFAKLYGVRQSAG